MFFDAPFPVGSEDFSSLFARLPIAQNRRVAHVARALDVCERSVRDWLAGRRAAPRAVCFFLWAYSPECISWVNDRAYRDAAHFGRLYMATQSRVDELTATVHALQQELDLAKRRAAPSRFVAANDPVSGRCA